MEAKKYLSSSRLMDIERFIFPWTLQEDEVDVEVSLSYRSTIT